MNMFDDKEKWGQTGIALKSAIEAHAKQFAEQFAAVRKNLEIKRFFKAPEETIVPEGFKSIFLAGSIEMGKAVGWQKTLTYDLLTKFNELVIFNPRRDDWDASWKQSITNKNFYEQVDWEHQHIEDADFVVLYLQAGTQSPISLLELGLCAAAGKNIAVCCEKDFWRKGNVDYICKKYKLKKLKSLDEVPAWLKNNGVK